MWKDLGEPPRSKLCCLLLRNLGFKNVDYEIDLSSANVSLSAAFTGTNLNLSILEPCSAFAALDKTAGGRQSSSSFLSSNPINLASLLSNLEKLCYLIKYIFTLASYIKRAMGQNLHYKWFQHQKAAKSSEQQAASSEQSGTTGNAELWETPSACCTNFLSPHSNNKNGPRRPDRQPDV